MKALVTALAITLALGGSASAASDLVNKLIATQAMIANDYANARCDLTERQKGAVFKMALETYRRFGLIAPIGQIANDYERWEQAAANHPMLGAVKRGDPDAIEAFCDLMRNPDPVFP
jgi:hypothetical protein